MPILMSVCLPVCQFLPKSKFSVFVCVLSVCVCLCVCVCLSGSLNTSTTRAALDFIDEAARPYHNTCLVYLSKGSCPFRFECLAICLSILTFLCLNVCLSEYLSVFLSVSNYIFVYSFCWSICRSDDNMINC